MTQEAVLKEIHQRLGPLNSQAQLAVSEVLEILRLPRESKSVRSKDGIFVGENVSVSQYEAWSRDERLRYQTEPEKANARWIGEKLRELRASWIIVSDGKVVASGSLTEYPTDDDFDALCEKFGKFPFVFLSPSVLVIEEVTSWHETTEMGDAYPTVPRS